MKLVLALVLIGQMRVTSYRSVPEATDSSPWITSTGERTGRDGVAVSQDLLKSGRLKYGDWIYIEEIGFRRVFDTMNPRHTNHIDFWVPTLQEEKEFDKKFRGKELKVYLVQSKKEKIK